MSKAAKIRTQERCKAKGGPLKSLTGIPYSRVKEGYFFRVAVLSMRRNAQEYVLVVHGYAETELKDTWDT